MAETGTYSEDGTPVLLFSMRNNPNLPPIIDGGKGSAAGLAALSAVDDQADARGRGARAPTAAAVAAAAASATGRSLRSYRMFALSRDGGLSWGAIWQAKQLPEPIKGCDGSLVYHPGTRAPHRALSAAQCRDRSRQRRAIAYAACSQRGMLRAGTCAARTTCVAPVTRARRLCLASSRR